MLGSIYKGRQGCFLPVAEAHFSVLDALQQVEGYSKTSIARTPMARLPWLIRTRFFFCPCEILPIAQENNYVRKFSISS